MTSTATATAAAATTAVGNGAATCTVTTKPIAAAAAAPVPALASQTDLHAVPDSRMHTAAAANDIGISFGVLEHQLQALELGDTPLHLQLHSVPPQQHQQQQQYQQQQQSYTGSASHNNNTSSSSSGSYSSTGRDSEPCLGTLLLDFLHLFSHEFEAGSEGLSVRGGGFRFPLDCGLSHPQASDPIVIEVRVHKHCYYCCILLLLLSPVILLLSAMRVLLVFCSSQLTRVYS
jgi:hypothetical protein